MADLAARRLGIATLCLPSGAGHDAMPMASLYPVGILFVRCLGGISHQPEQSITAADAARTVGVLAQTLHGLTGQSPHRR